MEVVVPTALYDETVYHTYQAAFLKAESGDPLGMIQVYAVNDRMATAIAWCHFAEMMRGRGLWEGDELLTLNSGLPGAAASERRRRHHYARLVLQEVR